MNVSLTPELEQFVAQEVESGLYQTASEVIRAGLRRLKQDQLLQLPKTPTTKQELEQVLLAAAKSIDSGKGVRGEEVFARLRQRSNAGRRNA